MLLESKKLLFDMHQAGSLIQQFASGKSLQDLETDPMFRSAVERQFEIIGEALGKLIKIDADTAHRITEYRRIIGFRNILIHGYDVILNRTTWSIIQDKLPVMMNELAAMLGLSGAPDDTRQ